MFLKYFSKGLIFSLTSAFLWACGIIITRLLLKDGENALNLTVWIYLVTLIPWLFLFTKHTKEFKKLSIKNIGLLIFIGIAGSIGINYLQSLALKNTSAVNFAFLYRTIVVFTIVFAWIFFKEKITRKKLFLLVFILVGSYLLTTKGQNITLSLGDIYTLLMAASAALFANILIKHTISKMHPDLSGSVTSTVAITTLVIFANLIHVFKIPQNLFLVFLGGVIYFTQIMLRNRAYKHATASFVTMIFSITPLFVAILSYPILHERLGLIELIGGIIILSSTILSEKFKI